MVSVATALAGHDIIRQLVPMIANAGWFATPENEWTELFLSIHADMVNHYGSRDLTGLL